MNNMKKIIAIFFLTLSFTASSLFAGDTINEQDDPTINNVDDKGLRQGKWIFFGEDQPSRGFPLDGKISEGPFVDSRKQGLWTMYFKDGKTPRTVGNFANNRPNGNFIKYYKNGKIKEEGVFTNMHYVDSLKRYNENGVLIYASQYNESGQEQGDVIYYYDNGQVQFEYIAVNGKPKGEAIRYWPNGDIKEKINYDANGKVISTSGEIERVSPKITTPKTNQEQQAKKAPLVQNKPRRFKKNGYNKIFNENKALWMEGAFKEGSLFDGRVYIYDKDGLLLKVEVYKEGRYFSDGQL